MKINKLIHLTPSKENNFAKIDKDIPKNGGVYFLYDADMELIYIGKSKNIRSRIQQHTTDNENSRLSCDDDDTIVSYGYGTCIPLGIVKFYSCIVEEDEDKRTMMELFFLHIIKTPFNLCDKRKAIENYFKEKL